MPSLRRALAILLAVAILLTLVAALHLYLVRRLVLDTGMAPPMRGAAAYAIAVLGVLLVVEPIAQRLLPRRLARIVAWPAFLWMGFAFFLLVSLGTADLLLSIAGRSASAGLEPAPGLERSARPSPPRAAARGRAAAAAGIAAFAGGVALASALRRPSVRRVELALARWPAALDGFRIAQLSDLHIGSLLGARFATQVVELVNAHEPDLIAVTGDLVDGGVRQLATEVAPLSRLRAPHGVFFVTGNHDYYSGADAWLDQVRALGMRALRNDRVTIGEGEASFDLAGVDDHHADLFGGDHGEDVPRALAGRDPRRAVVLLAHDPTTFKRAADLGIDLQISGHTHGGQLWPFRYLVRLAVPFVAGPYRRGAALLYVSRGTGFWGPPMRLFAPAEVTEIVLRRAPAAAGA
jgi:predicted MPP superfamily phosphohydrolase